MRLYIKNMVCSRCRMAVQAELEKAGLHPLTVELGEVEIGSKPSREELHRLAESLRKLGFELIDDKKSRIIEKIKNCIVQLVHYSADHPGVNLSDYIAGQL